MSELRKLVIIAMAHACEDALRKAADAEAHNLPGIANVWRDIAAYNSANAFKAARS